MSRARVITDMGSYEAVTDWARVPDGWSFGEVAGVAVGPRSEVYVFSRSEHPMMVFGRDGEFIGSWGEGVFSRPHNVRVAPDGHVFCSDSADHTVRKFSADGHLVQTLGTPNVPSDTGAEGNNYRTIKRAAGPFNRPTDTAFGPDGEIFVSDGYGNARVHRFSASGDLITSWGDIGAEPGHFNLPHGALIDSGRTLYVVDRENSRVQLFTLRGEFLAQWTDFARPTGIASLGDGTLLVSEFGYDPSAPAGPASSAPSHGRRTLPRLTVRSSRGELLAKLEAEDRCAPGGFFAPHAVAADANGDIYTAEVVQTLRAPQGCHTLQKLVKA